MGDVTRFAQPSEDGGSRPALRHALAGIHAGVLGALAMLACVMIGSAWDHRSIWSVPNLFATTFFGGDVYLNQLVRTSWCGLALIIAIYGFLGMIWGLIWGKLCGDKRRRALPLYGAIAGLLVYLFFNDLFWKYANPLFTVYAPDRQLELGHLLWGLLLARSPKYSRRIAESMSQKPGATPLAGDEVQAVSSGEVIR